MLTRKIELMKTPTILKIIGGICFFSISLFITHKYSFKAGEETGHEVGYKKGNSDGYNTGYQESEIVTTEKIYNNQRDSIQRIDLPIDEIIDQIDFQRIFTRISICNDCQNSQQCKSVYKQELKSVVNTIILELGKDNGLSTSQILATQKKIDLVKDQISEDAFNHFIALNCNQEPTLVSFSQNSSNINTVGNSIVSTYTTSSNFATTVGTVLCGQFIKSIFGSLCAVVMTQVVAPIDAVLKELSIIQDINNSKAIINDHIRHDIAELCTVEDEIDNSVMVQKHGWFGSTSELYVDIRSNIKAGIDLSKHFVINIDHGIKQIHIEVGYPEILSNETHILNRDIDDGWFTRGFTVDDLEKAENQGMDLNYTIAMNSGILDKASKNTLIILHEVISPMVSNPVYNYDLLITTKQGKMVNDDFELIVYEERY